VRLWRIGIGREIGSPSLATFLEQNHERLRNDVVIVSDSILRSPISEAESSNLPLDRDPVALNPSQYLSGEDMFELAANENRH
jgi:hypothetical protein